MSITTETSTLSDAQSVAKLAFDNEMSLSRSNVQKAKDDKTGKVYRVYADGIFDMAHLGHFRMLEQVKKSLGDQAKVYVLCGVCNDEDTIKFKGKVVMNHQTRCDTMKHCKWVDEVIVDAPWVISKEFMDRYKIDFVAHDALPYVDLSGASSTGDVYSPIKIAGKFLETQRTEGISTSDLIVTIVKDYDDYVQRNLNRGYSKKDLKVGRTWEIRAIAHENEAKFREALRNGNSHLHDLRDEVIAFMSEFSSDIAHNGVRFSNNNPDDNHPGHVTEIMLHTYGLIHAWVQAGFYAASWANPFSYCRKSKYH